MKICGKYIDEEEFKSKLKKADSFTDFANKLNIPYCNGRIIKIFKKYINNLGLNFNHFDPHLNAKLKAKYKIIKKKCPVCKNEFITKLGFKKEKTTCSIKCSNSYFYDLRYSDKSNKKRSNSIQKSYLKKNKNLKKINNTLRHKKQCNFCKSVFYTKKKKQKYCSVQCIYKDDNYRQILKESTAVRLANGTHKGWQSRSKINPSYPEKYIMSILDSMNINYVREFKVNKWFIDFADPNKKLALEIDGKQHDYPERKASDIQKDNFLINEGWKVLRIRWKKPTLEFRNYCINQIQAFFNELN